MKLGYLTWGITTGCQTCCSCCPVCHFHSFLFPWPSHSKAVLSSPLPSSLCSHPTQVLLYRSDHQSRPASQNSDWIVETRCRTCGQWVSEQTCRYTCPYHFPIPSREKCQATSSSLLQLPSSCRLGWRPHTKKPYTSDASKTSPTCSISSHESQWRRQPRRQYPHFSDLSKSKWRRRLRRQQHMSCHCSQTATSRWFSQFATSAHPYLVGSQWCPMLSVWFGPRLRCWHAAGGLLIPPRWRFCC